MDMDRGRDRGRVRIKVDELLEERGMTVADLVARTGLSYNTALALKRNASTTLRLDTIARICDALGVRVERVLVYEPVVEAVA